jgi:hypothetical protein
MNPGNENASGEARGRDTWCRLARGKLAPAKVQFREEDNTPLPLARSEEAV